MKATAELQVVPIGEGVSVRQQVKQVVELSKIQQAFVDAGVWIRPFGKLIYLMPPYIIQKNELKLLCNAIFNVLNECSD